MARHPNRASESSRLRLVFCFVLFIAATIAIAGAIGSSRATGQHVGDNVFHLKIAPWVIEHTANGHQAEFFVVLADRADLRSAATLATKAEKGRYVYDALRKKSQETQGPILRWLRERAIEHRSFYIVNAILVKGSREIAEALAARPDVARVEGNPRIRNILPQPEAGDQSSSHRKRRRQSSRASLTRTRRMYGRWVSGARESRLLALIPASAGRITHSSLTIAAGTESLPITITTGMIPSTTALATLAGTIRLSLAMITVMALIR